MILRHPPASPLKLNGISNACLRFLREVTKPAGLRPITHNLSCTSRTLSSAIAPSRIHSEYFCSNGLLERVRTSAQRSPHIFNTSTPTPLAQDGIPKRQTKHSQHLPHRRRQEAEHATTTQERGEFTLPNNASSTLTEQASALPARSAHRLLTTLLSLSKPRLSILVVLTAMASYSLYPVPELLQPASTQTPSLSPLTLLFLTTGTALCAASANALNMLYEPKWDAMMSRTRNQPLVRGLISPRGALAFAILAGALGVSSLYFGVNPTVACLGGLNIALYAGVYTPLKRVTVLNTWVGALVGGIPPLMGWAAAAGQSAIGSGTWRELLLGEENIGAWLLASLLFAWQLAHFMSLSYPIRNEYKNAGYKMLCWTNPARNARVALRYSLLLFPICVGLCSSGSSSSSSASSSVIGGGQRGGRRNGGICEWWFAWASAPVNAWLGWQAGRFWWFEGARGSARSLFWASVWHLPVVLCLALAGKRDLWGRIWRALGWSVYDDEEVGMDDFDDEGEEE